MGSRKSCQAKHQIAFGDHSPISEPLVQGLGSRIGIGYFQDHLSLTQFHGPLVNCLQQHGTDAVVAPIGGGGMISGTCLAMLNASPQTEIYAAEPKNADDAQQSFKAGHIIPVDKPNTIADGLRTSLGDLTFPIIHKHLQQIVTTTEQAIADAMRLIWERSKLIVEPSGAVPLAAIQTQPELFAGKRVGVILSGGNADLDNLPW